MKNYVYALSLTVFTIASLHANAQSAPQTVIASAEAFVTFANGSMTWTIGEVMTETYAPTGYFFTQGFNQPDTAFLTVISAEPATQNVSVFPNPVVDNLVIDFSLTSGNQIVEIFDIQGQLLKKESIPANQNRLNVSFREFANGVYLLNIVNVENQIRTSYKINKAE
jgi:hypothetical protein